MISHKASNTTDQFPDSIFKLLYIAANGFRKNLSKNFVKSLFISGIVFLINLLLVSIGDKMNLQDNSFLSSLMVRPGNILKGSILWAALSGLFLSLFQKTKIYGLGKMLKGCTSSIGPILNIKRNYKNIPFLIGAFIALLFSMLMGNAIFSAALFLSFITSAAFNNKSSLIFIARFAGSQLKKIIKKKKEFEIKKGLHLVEGFSLGFGLYSILVMFKQGIFVQIVFLILFSLMVVIRLKKFRIGVNNTL